MLRSFLIYLSKAAWAQQENVPKMPFVQCVS